jgi:hypothetical protein
MHLDVLAGAQEIAANQHDHTVRANRREELCWQKRSRAEVNRPASTFCIWLQINQYL